MMYRAPPELSCTCAKSWMLQVWMPLSCPAVNFFWAVSTRPLMKLGSWKMRKLLISWNHVSIASSVLPPLPISSTSLKKYGLNQELTLSPLSVIMVIYQCRSHFPKTASKKLTSILLEKLVVLQTSFSPVSHQKSSRAKPSMLMLYLVPLSHQTEY